MADEVPVVDGMFTSGPDGSARLIGGWCGSCGELHFPRAEVCPFCRAAPVDERLLGASGGALWAWTAVTSAPPGYTGPVPYGFGVVELDEGLRVVTRLTESDPRRLSFGRRMRCVVDRLADDDQGRPIVVWAFTAADGVPS